jgi:hypothetical protein
MYMRSGIVGNTHGYQQQQLAQVQQPHYNNDQPTKRRRATNPTKITPQIHPAPLPTPSSTTYPANVKTSRPSDAGLSDVGSNPSPGATSLPHPPFTPPPNTNNLNTQPTTNGSANGQGSGQVIPFSPNFSFSPLPQFASLAPSPVPRAVHLNTSNNDTSVSHFDPMLSMPTPYEQQPTPGAGSTSGTSVHTDPDSKDPFLSLLEQLAENEVSRGGPSELDFFLSGQNA